MLIAAAMSSAFGAIRPSFRLDHSVWKATDVVLAVTTTTDGTFEVVESWKGDLRAGQLVVVPELRPPANAQQISTEPASEPRLCNPGSQAIPKQPSGSRIVLFLVKSGDLSQRMEAGKIEIGGWKPSDLLDSMQASVVWIDGSEPYAFEQVVNPGPPLLCKLPTSETEIRNRVAEVSSVQAQVSVAISVENGEDRAERLRPFVGSDILPARLEALEQLGKCGPSSVRVISGMLDDPAFADQESDLIDDLATAGGWQAGKELHRRLANELEFWRTKGPTLLRGWIDRDTSIHAPLRERFWVTRELVVGLGKVRYRPARDTVAELRTFWRSVPQLSDGFGEFLQDCDKTIQLLGN